VWRFLALAGVGDLTGVGGSDLFVLPFECIVPRVQAD
jgi:hypothetical protein